MLVLGVILILLAAGATIAAIAGTSNEPVTFDLSAFSVDMAPLGVFLTGAATVLLLVLGVGLVRAGLRGARKRRKEKKQLNRLSEKLVARETAPEGGARTGTTATSTSDRPEDGVTGTDRPAQ